MIKTYILKTSFDSNDIVVNYDTEKGECYFYLNQIVNYLNFDIDKAKESLKNDVQYIDGLSTNKPIIYSNSLRYLLHYVIQTPESADIEERIFDDIIPCFETYGFYIEKYVRLKFDPIRTGTPFLTLKDFAIMIHDKYKYPISADDVKAVLRFLGLLCVYPENYNQPTTKGNDLELFNRVYDDLNDQYIVVLNPKGVNYLMDLYLANM